METVVRFTERGSGSSRERVGLFLAKVNNYLEWIIR